MWTSIFFPSTVYLKDHHGKVLCGTLKMPFWIPAYHIKNPSYQPWIYCPWKIFWNQKILSLSWTTVPFISLFQNHILKGYSLSLLLFYFFSFLTPVTYYLQTSRIFLYSFRTNVEFDYWIFISIFFFFHFEIYNL